MTSTDSNRSPETSNQPTDSSVTSLPVTELAQHAIEAAFSKKATDIVVMDMQSVSGVADIFILCTGTSDLQIKAIYQAIRARIREYGDELPWHMEGTESLQWVLLDYVNLVVHIFSEEKRAFYDLERLWGDAPKASVSEEDLIESISILKPS
ncbi:MAG: ribosome silencing factor [Rhodothermaceae bacterium]|nr:ribosome silencing factor [Rhodothermaceae bacterium]